MNSIQGDTTLIMENQIEKNMENEMEATLYIYICTYIYIRLYRDYMVFPKLEDPNIDAKMLKDFL